MAAPSLVLQTTYAELLDRCAQAAFGKSFPADGVFTPKTIRGRRYWYFQLPSKSGRAQIYAGPETPELLQRIEHHQEVRDDERERRSLVSTLVRSFGMPQPIPEIGAIVEALAKAGVFRLRGVLVGTVAYQTYSAMLGTKLPLAALQTGDVDIAQFKNVSVAVEDQTPPVLDVLKQADKSFRPVPTLHGTAGDELSRQGRLPCRFPHAERRSRYRQAAAPAGPADRRAGVALPRLPDPRSRTGRAVVRPGRPRQRPRAAALRHP